ncbi:hypothetical protein ES703_34515 [subsurface metagenome]
MTEIQLILLLIAAILGAIVSSLLGWAESNEAFNARKFMPSIVRAAIAAVAVFLTVTYIDIGAVTLVTYVAVFLSGMGIDAGGNRISGTLRTKE